MLSQFFNFIFNLAKSFFCFLIQTYTLVFLRFFFPFFDSFRGFTCASYSWRSKLIYKLFFISTASNRLFHRSFWNTYALIFVQLRLSWALLGFQIWILFSRKSFISSFQKFCACFKNNITLLVQKDLIILVKLNFTYNSVSGNFFILWNVGNLIYYWFFFTLMEHSFLGFHVSISIWIRVYLSLLIWTAASIIFIDFLFKNFQSYSHFLNCAA